MTPPDPLPVVAVTEGSIIPGAQLALIIAIVGSVVGGLVGIGAIFSHELSPIREDITEMKTDIRELRDRPAPQGIIDRLDSLSRRIETLERK